MPDHPLPAVRPVRAELVPDALPARHSTADLLEWVSFLMDRLFTVPGTRKRFGLNSLMLLLPILGDVLPTLISFGILAVGLGHYRVPRIVAARMVLNSLLDASISWVPIVGNLWDVWFKADTRNVRLLREYLGKGEQPPRPAWRHWVFVGGLLAFLALFLALLILGAVLLVARLLRPGAA